MKMNLVIKSKTYVLALILVMLLASSINSYSAAPDVEYDIVIKGGTIMNPETEHELKGFNLAISNGKIVKITDEELTGNREINAEGLVISPGFIDLISYEPNDEGVKYKILDGVTSNLLMHGGTENAKSWYDYWQRRGRKINYGASSFITRLRWNYVGHNIDKSMTNEDDIKKLVQEVRENIEEGALGISFSFEYVPGISSEEVIPLLHLANEYNAPTFYHLRYSDTEAPGTSLEGIQEVIDYAKETDAAIHIMHINSTGGTFVMDEALEMVRSARDEGLDVTSCVYPYDFWATYTSSARFRPGWQERYHITYSNLQVGGTSIVLSEQVWPDYRRMHTLVAAHGSMPEEELIMALEEPYIMIGSDTIIEPSHNNHPRGAGTYGRLFGVYVREMQVISLMDGVRKASYLPAKRMEDIAPSMKRKGRIEIGADADLTIFNPETIKDKSTVEKPATASEGIEYVIVNGVVIKDESGIINGVNPGQPILSYFVDDSIENQPIQYEISLDDGVIGDLDAYTIEGEKYFPIVSFMELMDQPLEINNYGEIQIGETSKLQIGSISAYRYDNEAKLVYGLVGEPIIYKGQIYVNEKDLGVVLADIYEVKLMENAVALKTIEKAVVDNGVEDEDNGKIIDGNEDKEDSEDDMNNNIVYIVLIVIALATAIYLFIKKAKSINKK